jgi:hypothetical protein
MSYFLPDGAKLFISTTFSAAKTVTGISNANPPLVTAVAHGWVDGNEVLISSGWSDMTDTVFKIDQQSVDTFLALGFDATNTTFFPTGSGGGTAKLISSWVQVPQLLDSQDTGGDAKEVVVSPMDQRNDISLPAGFNASKQSLEFGWDPSLVGQQAVLSASQSQAPTAFKWVLPGNVTVYGFGRISANEKPSISKGKVMTMKASITSMGRTTYYVG